MEYSQYSSLLKLRYRPSTGYLKSPKLENLTVQLHYTMDGKEKFILSVSGCVQFNYAEIYAYCWLDSHNVGPLPSTRTGRHLEHARFVYLEDPVDCGKFLIHHYLPGDWEPSPMHCLSKVLVAKAQNLSSGTLFNEWYPSASSGLWDNEVLCHVGVLVHFLRPRDCSFFFLWIQSLLLLGFGVFLLDLLLLSKVAVFITTVEHCAYYKPFLECSAL